MRSLRPAFAVLLFLVSGLVSNNSFSQENSTSKPAATLAGLAGLLDYDGGTGLLKLEQIQSELNISPEQSDSLRNIEREVLDLVRSFYDRLSNMSAEDRRARLENIDQEMHQIGKATLDKVKEVLLPGQFERFQQIKLQLAMRRAGGLLNADVVSGLLQMTAAEREQLRENERQVLADLREKITQARQEALQKLLDSLTPDQRAQLEELIGKPFDFPWGQPAAGG